MSDTSAPGFTATDANAGPVSGAYPLPKAPRSPRLDTGNAVRIELGRALSVRSRRPLRLAHGDARGVGSVFAPPDAGVG